LNGRNGIQKLSIIFTAMFLAGPILMAFMPGTDVTAQRVKVTLTTTKEGWSSVDSTPTFGPLHQYLNLSLSKYWNIENASISVTGEPAIYVAGDQKEYLIYPMEPSMNLDPDGRIWAWPNEFGQQYFFYDDLSSYPSETNTIQREFKTNETVPIYIKLPTGAKIQDIRFDVNSTQRKGRYDFSMTVGASPKVVWQRSSIGFAKGPSIPTRDAGENVTINSVCVDNLDPVLDTHKDIVAAGNGDRVYVVLHDVNQASGFVETPQMIKVGSDDPPGNLLDCALGDMNKDNVPDLALSTSDGKAYVLKNYGNGILLTPAYEIAINTSRVDSVALGDVNGDNWGDVVGGYMDGRFAISTWSTQKGAFNAPYEVKAGTGSVNGLAIRDMNFDNRNDIIGANENRHWYILKNNGSGWNIATPVSCGENDLISLAVADLNNDRQPDLISGSTDGAFYVAYDNFGSFDRGQKIRGGSQVMKDLAVDDLDLDGNVDVLGLDGDGWVYLSRNINGVLQDAVPLVHVGAEKNTLALGDLNNDKAPDLILGGTDGITVYWNTNGPFVETIGKGDKSDLKSEVQAYLDAYKVRKEDLDDYGNPIVRVPFYIHSKYATNLTFENVTISYNFEKKVDLTRALNDYINSQVYMADHEGNLDARIMIDFWGSGTKLHFTNISITYDVELASIIDSPIEHSAYNLTDWITFKGHSNLDKDCALLGFQYTWMVDGKVAGSGCNFKSSVLDKFGDQGKHKVRLMVQQLATQEIVYSDVDITVLPPTPPVIYVQPIVLAEAGKEINITVQATDKDPSDQANLTYGLWSGPKGMTINTTTGVIHWQPAKGDVGNNTVVVEVSDGKNTTMATFNVRVDKGPSPVAVNPCFAWPVILTIVIVGLAFGVVFVETEVGIFALYSLAFFMYTRLKQEMVLDNFVRGQIYGHICENPGLHLAEIQRKLKISAGTLIYHLKTLEREGLVKSYPNGSQRVFFSSSVKVPKELMSLTKAQRWILKAIEERPGISQKELSDGTGLSDSTVNRIVHELEERGMVRIEKGKTTQCFIVDN